MIKVRDYKSRTAGLKDRYLISAGPGSYAEDERVMPARCRCTLVSPASGEAGQQDNGRISLASGEAGQRGSPKIKPLGINPKGFGTGR
ncbi:hypothetical protein FHS59_003915 [Algoriphagus iocasae]|uniref:Uncharacterized protein n=1 Tax=Algoriphagus iocasae TaxID=1836499 RepID=A0A841MJ02_9BACT|nr:hypothetical protein [Algoriphagus iocasae]MBB6328272.1 hypothetical protein [Algoriphagus iocasae]